MKPTEVVVSIAVGRELLDQADELAAEKGCSRSSVLHRAIGEYIEREYARLIDIRESERELAEGKGIPHARVEQMVADLKAGRGWPDEFK